MGLTQYIIETGMGSDFCGGDVTKAAKRAVKDALSHSGLYVILGSKNPEKVIVDIVIGSPFPEKVKEEKIKKVIPFGTKQIKSRLGGLLPDNMDPSSDKEAMILVVAVLTIYIDETK